MAEIFLTDEPGAEIKLTLQALRMQLLGAALVVGRMPLDDDNLWRIQQAGDLLQEAAESVDYASSIIVP